MDCPDPFCECQERYAPPFEPWGDDDQVLAELAAEREPRELYQGLTEDAWED
jgi:hypothetical protein